MLDVLPSRSCWTKADAEAVLRIEALEGDDTLFLATHTPIRDFDMAGAQRQDVLDASEAGLLEALADPERKHAFCVVQGEPGSGKSHLIRWLSVNWPVATDVVLLLQRADGSLEGALSQLQSRLTAQSPAFAPLFERIGRRQNARMAGRAAVFLGTLGAMLEPEYFEKPPEDAAWCGQHDLADLLQNAHVRRGWGGPRRVLELIDGKAQARNSESASFNLDDVVDLARFGATVADTGASQIFARRLMTEAADIGDARRNGASLEEARLALAGKIRASLGLLDALNRRRNDAVQNVIGVSGDSLKTLFTDLRKMLHQQGRRLVLLLEDITAWQGLDNSLIDALIVNADTRDDVCALISVVGVTPEYHDELRNNYRDRITHEVGLGAQARRAEGSVAARDADTRRQFVARYLNAARAGVIALRAWRERQTRDVDLPPPNPCSECDVRDNCHAVFGAVEGMGLYPFTPDAIDRFYGALKVTDRQSHRTPRGLLQSVLGPTLRQPAMLDERRYPGPDIETDALDEREVLVSGPLRTRLDVSAPDGPTRERLRRTLVFWGDKHRAVTTALPGGGLAFADAPRGVFDSFNLPWIGDDAPGRIAPAPEPDLPEPAPIPLFGADVPLPVDRPPARPEPRPDQRPAPPRPPAARPSTAPKSQIEKLKGYIAEARDGQPIREPLIWNSVLYDLVSKLDARALGFDRWVWTSLFNASLVTVEGVGQTRGSHFVVPRAAWLCDGLEAYASLRVGGLDEAVEELHRRRLAFLVRRLGGLAAAHARRRLPQLPDGGRWDMVASITQVLLARAWLRGDTAPSASTAEQWRAVLGDEGEVRTDPFSRTEPWQDALRNTDKQHEKLKPMLREMVSLPQGTSPEFGLADAGAAARAVLRLRDRFGFSPISEAANSTALLDDGGLRATAAKVADSLSRTPGLELNLLKGRAQELDALLHGESIRARAQRIETVIQGVYAQVREAPPEQQRKWREDWQRLVPVLDRPEAMGAIQQLILDLAGEGDDPPDARAPLLGWLAARPAGDLRAVLELLKSGEALAGALLVHVRGYVAQGGGGADLSALNAAGARLKAAGVAARSPFGAPR